MRDKDRNENYKSNNSVVIPPLRFKVRALKVMSHMGIIARHTVSYPGTAELMPLQGTIVVDRRGMNENSQANLKKQRTGLPTVSSMRNLRKCMDVFAMSLVRSKSRNPVTQRVSFMKAAFLTFTIPDAHTMLDSKEGYNKLLKHMIEFLIYHDEVSRYVWRFERQDRGQAHWHVCVNRYIDLHRAKTYWLKLLAKEGLTSDYYEKYDYDPVSALVVQGVRSTKELKFYFDKYFSKKTQSDKPTAGRWWGADLVTKRMPLPLVPVTELFCKRLEVFEEAKIIDVYEPEIERVDATQLHLPEAMRKKEIYRPCQIIRARKIKMEEVLCPVQRKVYYQFISFNRQGNVEGAVSLRNEVLGRDREVQRWIGDHLRMADDMEFLARLKKIEKVSKVVLTNRQRKKRLLAEQAAREASAPTGVSLFT